MSFVTVCAHLWDTGLKWGAGYRLLMRWAWPVAPSAA
jgi:hypothetical protein